MKRIFHIISNHEWGGGEQYVFDLAQRQLQEGWQIEVFCRPVETIAQKFREQHIIVHTLPLKGSLDIVSAIRMAATLRHAGTCTIHAHNFKDAYTAAYARRLAGNSHIRVVMCRHLTRTGKNSLLYRWLYRQLDALCFDSALSRDTFLSTAPSIDKKKICIVHTSIVVPDQLQAVPLRTEFNIPQTAAIAMYHGRLDPEKGLDVLIEAASLLKNKDFRLLLIGRGTPEYTAHLQQLIADKGLTTHVILAGFRHPVLPYVANADFGILASVVQEGCPLSPQEYMSQGHPVIATDNGGQREYIDSGRNGILVTPGNAQQLANAMDHLIADRALCSQLGQQAKADFDDHLNYNHFFRQIKQLYHDGNTM